MKTLTRILVPLLLGALVACHGGGGGGGGENNDAGTTPAAGPVVVSPKSATLKTGGSATFSASVDGAAETRVLWSVRGGDAPGTITSTGVYTAPDKAGTYQVVVTSALDSSKTDTAEVTVVAGVGVTVTPATAQLDTGGSATFSAQVTGATNPAVTWSIQEGDAGGATNPNGVYTAPGTPGFYTIVATSVEDPTKKGLARVAVSATPAVTVTISPTSQSLLARGTATFTATVTGSKGSQAVTWSVTGGDANGSINPNGVYTAPDKGGTFTVVATSVADPTKSATAQVTVTAVSIQVSPATATSDQSGTTTFTATVTGTPNTAVKWSVTGGSANGTLSSDGVYTAPNKAGTFTVVATSVADPTKSATAQVTVSDVAIQVSPATATSSQGATTTFTATVTGTPNTAVKWSADGGTINPNGVYTAPNKAGTFTVVATSVADPTKKASAQVTVGEMSIQVSPATATVDQGGTATFTATVTGTSNTAVTWSVTGGKANGSISSDGVYTAPNKGGTFTVVATSVADPTKSATAQVTVNDVAIQVSPTTATSAQGATTTFTATVTGTPNTAVKWSVTGGSANGTLSSDGVYTAPNKGGTFTVVATSVADPTKSATAQVTVGEASIQVSPATATSDQGATTAFTATVTGTPNTAVKWSVTGGSANGTISSDGVYTAPNKAGTFTVVATSVADSTKSATAQVTVNTVSIQVSPATATSSQGATTTFTATVTGTTNTAVTWTVDGGSANGSINPNGVYTAPNKTGTFTVIATSVADPTQKATATVTVPVSQGTDYMDPPAAADWRLVKNTSASSGNHLVLDLLGPAGQAGRGVSLSLSVDTAQASWAKVSPADTELVTNRAFSLGDAPQLLKGAASGGVLRVGVFQKGTSGPATSYSGPLLSVALELKSRASVPAGGRIPLTLVKAQALTEGGDLRSLDVAVGTLIGQ